MGPLTPSQTVVERPAAISTDAVHRRRYGEYASLDCRGVTTTLSESLSQLEVLVVDCQATAAAPQGHLLEIGWARAGTTTTDTHAQLIALPNGERIPPAVTRLTGISDRMAQDGIEAHVAWRELSNEAATLATQPAP